MRRSLQHPNHRRTARRAIGVLATVTAVVTLAAACGDDEPETSAPSTTEVADATTTTQADGTAAPGGGATSVWRQTAAQHRGKIGEQFTLECTPGGEPAAVWGAGIYTDDSSICTAAVQMGLIDLADGGEVTYEIAEGQDSYEAGLANGITSAHYGPYEGSFTFPDAPPGSVTFDVPAESWGRNAADLKDRVGEEVTFQCSPGGTFGSVWGTGTYTADSSVCTAAVHAGVLDHDEGGEVTIEIGGPADSFEGSTANGVTSSEYGPYDATFTFPGGAR